MVRRFRHALLLALLLLLTVSLPLAAAQDSVDVRIGKQAQLVNGGQAVDLKVRASCPEGYEVLEAFVYVTQDGNQSTFGGIPLVCDGRQQRFTVRVFAFEGSPLFQPGAANASAFVLVLDPATQGTLQGQDSGSITLR